MQYFLLFFACFCASTASILAKLSSMPSAILLIYRLAITLLIMVPYLIVYQRNEFKTLTKGLLFKIALSGISFALHLLCFFEALKFTGITEVNILVSTEVLFIALVELVFMHKGISAKGWVFLILSCVAAYFVISGSAVSNGNMSYSRAIIGNLLAVLSSVFTAIYTLLGRNIRKHVSMPVYTFVLYTFSLIVSLIYALTQKYPIFGYQNIDIIYAAGLAIFATILGHNLFSYSLKHFKSSLVSSAKLTSPIFSSLLALMFFNKYPTVQVIIASAIMIFTIYGYIQVEKYR